MKKETLADPRVKELLSNVEFIIVDLDEHPQLGKAYGVSAVPDVLFIDGKGKIVDRLNAFEPPEPFRTRLLNLLR